MLALSEGSEPRSTPVSSRLVASSPAGSETRRQVPTRVSINGRAYGVNLVDKRTGNLYHYDFETCVSRWGAYPPDDRNADGGAEGSAEEERLSRNGTSAKKMKNTSESREDPWVTLRDSHGREFMYNRVTCESKWL